MSDDIRPSQIRERLRQLGYVLAGLNVRTEIVDGDISTTTLTPTSSYEADEMLRLAITGGDKFERVAKERKRITDAPLRGVVSADEVYDTGRWLVTLDCGHKKYVGEKLGEYPCLECPREPKR